MEGKQSNLEQLKYATEYQIEIGKILQSFDPILRPLEDMAKHGITMAAGLLGISASILGGFASGKLGVWPCHLLLFAAWSALVVATVAGSVELHRIAKFRETIRDFCHVLLGKDGTTFNWQSAEKIMKTPQKNALVVEYWTLSIGVVLFFVWAVMQILPIPRNVA